MKLIEIKNSNIWMAGYFEDETELTHNFSRLSFFSSKEKAAKDLVDALANNLDKEDFQELTNWTLEDAEKSLKKNDTKAIVKMADAAIEYAQEEHTGYIIIFEPVRITA